MRRLVVCTGNTCRSPMAKALIEAIQPAGDEVKSAGLSTTGVAASVFAVMALKEKGIDLSFHKSQLLTADMVAWADEIGVMTPAHKVAVTSVFEVDPDRVLVLGKGIPDPFGLSLDDYRMTRDVLEKAVAAWLDPTAIHVVPLRGEHIAAIASIEKVSFADPWSEAALSEELLNDCARFFVAERGGKVVGYLGSHEVAGEIAITNVAVAPDARRQGVAAALLNAVAAYAKKHAVTRITLEVRVSNAPAIALYESAGYIKDGIRPRFYAHPTEDAAIYSRYFKEGDTVI